MGKGQLLPLPFSLAHEIIPLLAPFEVLYPSSHTYECSWSNDFFGLPTGAWDTFRHLAFHAGEFSNSYHRWIPTSLAKFLIGITQVQQEVY